MDPEDDWFWYDESECGSLTAKERRFARAIRQCARSWPGDPGDGRRWDRPEPDDSFLWRGPDAGLLALLHVQGPPWNRSLLTVGAVFDGESARCDEVHNQRLYLPLHSSPLAHTVSGAASPEQTATRVADWFEALFQDPRYFTNVIRLSTRWQRCGNPWPPDDLPDR
ncbi:hypothetical protein RI138_31970 [Streptomyces sp. C11-1]|uniref:Uncharacterized protein n=1 Tax=Streptomyces durocortorensis TaxID=2811104 RepID=A0ABY9W4K3_9ACTN|nr:hypothetical protein [Streptomyces durocortorensis]WNF31076.1 hypothetical protein RI138_31970 [Streptomyces durocortorensis]